ncbi:Pecanex-like protein 4 [Quaeritorhiza haematococci]|nr:Pecanex-like protein 4 [Quaeritorhiza haematococci]
MPVVLAACMVYLSPSDLKLRYGDAGGILFYLFGWFSTLLAAWSWISHPPIEPNTYYAEDPYGIDEFTRPFHLSLVLLLAYLEEINPWLSQINFALRIIYCLFPLLWALGTLPSIRVFVPVVVEKCFVLLGGGTPTLTDRRLFFHVTVATILNVIVCTIGTFKRASTPDATAAELASAAATAHKAGLLVATIFGSMLASRTWAGLAVACGKLYRIYTEWQSSRSRWGKVSAIGKPLTPKAAMKSTTATTTTAAVPFQSHPHGSGASTSNVLVSSAAVWECVYGTLRCGISVGLAYVVVWIRQDGGAGGALPASAANTITDVAKIGLWVGQDVRHRSGGDFVWETDCGGMVGEFMAWDEVSALYGGGELCGEIVEEL